MYAAHPIKKVHLILLPHGAVSVNAGIWLMCFPDHLYLEKLKAAGAYIEKVSLFMETHLTKDDPDFIRFGLICGVDAVTPKSKIITDTVGAA